MKKNDYIQLLESQLMAELKSQDDQSVQQEAARTSMVRYTRQAKRQRYAGQSAMTLARKAKDPLYFRYIRLRKMALQVKERIMKKYGRRGMQIARKKMR